MEITETLNKYENMIIEQTKMLSKQNTLNKSATINLEELKFIKENIGLSVSEKEFLFDILNYLSVGTNIIIDENGNATIHKKIANNLNIDVKSLQRKFANLIDKKIVYQFKIWNKAYYVLNPYICYRGFVIDQVYSLFDLIGYKQDIKSKIVKIKNKAMNITKEKILEILLTSNLDQIEEGLVLIKTQYEVENGYIDILAKDKNGTKTIIEIKVKNDDSKLVEQCVYYPTQFNEKTRMITIAPDYTKKLFHTLNSLGYVEFKKYNIENNNLIIEEFKQNYTNNNKEVLNIGI